MNQTLFTIFDVPITRQNLVHDFLLSGFIPGILNFLCFSVAFGLWLQKRAAEERARHKPQEMTKQANKVADELKDRGYLE